MYRVDGRSKVSRYIDAVIDIRLSDLSVVDTLSVDESYFMDYLDFKMCGDYVEGLDSRRHKFVSPHLYIYGNKIQDHHSTSYHALVSYFEGKGVKIIDEKILSLCYIALVLFQYSIDVAFFLRYMDENALFDVNNFIDSYISFTLD